MKRVHWLPVNPRYHLPASFTDRRVDQRGIGPSPLGPPGGGRTRGARRPATPSLTCPATRRVDLKQPRRAVLTSIAHRFGACAVFVARELRHSSSFPAETMRANSAVSPKCYSRPFTSPGRGLRVVTEAEIQISGRRRRRAAPTVLFPTPEGPESTVSREFFRSAGKLTPSGGAFPAAAVSRVLPTGASVMSSHP